jgi:ubiquinone/menaquinone biosynthesis C-methylase UbiE
MSTVIEKPAEARAIQAAWDRIAPGYDEFVTSHHMPLAEESLRRAGLRAGTRFLDVAAGSGTLSIPASRMGASVLATDISPVMLRHLEMRARKEGLAIETRVMDGHALALEDESFDCAGSQFGVMLFPDMPRGLREMARVVKPGGRVLLVAFGDMRRVEFFAFFAGALRAVVPSFAGPPRDPPPLPFQLQDPERVRREFAAAGLGDIRVEQTSGKLVFASGQAMWDWLVNSNPIVGAVLSELNLGDEQTRAVVRALEAKIRERANGAEHAVLTHPINVGIGTR